MNTISFPGLGISVEVKRLAFSVFGLDVYWYGIIIAVGFLLAVLYCNHRTKDFGIKKDDLLDMLIFAVPLAIIGARAYYVLFMYDEYYYGNPQLMFQIWDGGVAIYGAIIAGVLTVLVFCLIKRIRVGTMLDLCVLGLLIGQAIGRWGNFVNQEAYGTATNLPWAMQLSNGALVHPCFLYESLWNVVGFVILHFYSKKRRYSGEIFLIYTAWYGFGRGLIEGLRTDSLYLFGTGLRVSQFFGFFTCIVALGVLVYLYLFREQDAEALANPYLPKRVRKSKRGDEDLPEEEDEDGTPDYVGMENGEENAGYMKGDEGSEEDDASFYGEEAEKPSTVSEQSEENGELSDQVKEQKVSEQEEQK